MSSLAFPMNRPPRLSLQGGGGGGHSPNTRRVNRPPRLVARASVLADLVLAAQGEEGAAAGAGRPPPQLL